MKYILGGHWTAPPEGWTVLTEQEQDLTAPLKWIDNSVDALFSEHVIEHLSLTDGIIFLKDAYRVLKSGGVIRTVCPFIESLSEFEDGGDLNRNYVNYQLSHYYPSEFIILRELGIDPLNHGKPFMFDSLLKKHNHKFVWSASLLSEVLKNIGFLEVYHLNPHESISMTRPYPERRISGLNMDELPNKNLIYNSEGFVVEAKK